MAQNRFQSSRRKSHRLMAEINITPFVDVMLVLLIVFMITAPLLTVGVPVDLPENQAATLQGSDEPLAITIQGNGQIFLQEGETSPEQLIPRLRAITRNNSDVRIFIRADKTLAYGQVMAVMGQISEAGFHKVSLIASPQP